jgi:hypothetical protein
MVILARILSFLFHPLLVPTYLFLLFAWLFPMGLSPIPATHHLNIVILLVMVTFILPILLLSILKTFGFISSFYIEKQRERIFPGIMISLMYITITGMFYFQSGISLDENFMRMMLVVDLLVVVAALFGFFYKISLHSFTIWGIVGILIPLNKLTEFDVLFYPAVFAILLAGIIMSSRLLLQVHSLKEVMWGSVAGLATGILGMMIFF